MESLGLYVIFSLLLKFLFHFCLHTALTYMCLSARADTFMLLMFLLTCQHFTHCIHCIVCFHSNHSDHILWMNLSVCFVSYRLTSIYQHLHPIVHTCWMPMVHGCSRHQRTLASVCQVWDVQNGAFNACSCQLSFQRQVFSVNKL